MNRHDLLKVTLLIIFVYWTIIYKIHSIKYEINTIKVKCKLGYCTKI